MTEFDTMLDRVRACTACAQALPLGPRPVFQLSPTATILVASQAPGAKAHASGIPFSDQSGERLRDWMEERARLAGAADPDALSRKLMLVFAGAQSQALVERSTRPAADARVLAGELLDAAPRTR